jgi:NTE family protein
MPTPRLGLALSCGSARGWSHIGVLEALAARGLRPDVVVGASVGALVAGACAAGTLGPLGEWVCTLTQRDVWRLVDTTFRGGGVMTGNRLMSAVAQCVTDPPIESLPVAFGAVATDLQTGEEVWLREGSLIGAVRASSGLPGLFAPSWYQQRWLIDGGVVNPLPVSLCRALGADLVIAVDLSRPVSRAGLRAQRQPAPEDSRLSVEGAAVLQKWHGLVDGLVESFRTRRNEPGLFETMASSVNIMQDRITRTRLAIEPADLVLHPDLAEFQLMDFHRAREAIDVGHATVERARSALDEVAARLGPAR